MTDETAKTGVPHAAQEGGADAPTAAPRRKPQRGVKGGRVPVMGFRASDAEKAEIEARAQAARLTPSGYLRARALDDPGPRTHRVPPVNAQALAHLTWQVAKLGNNVNQIARALHAFGRSAEQQEAEQVYRDIGATLEAIRAAITGRGAP